jgi:hypothetical protein
MDAIKDSVVRLRLLVDLLKTSIRGGTVDEH